MKSGRLWVVLFVLLGLACGCTTNVGELYDFDGDGSLDADDCDTTNPDIYPGAEDPFGDQIDQNCDGIDGVAVDQDGDGYTNAVDCDDQDPASYPGAEDPEGDGIDQNCDGVDGVASAGDDDDDSVGDDDSAGDDDSVGDDDSADSDPCSGDASTGDTDGDGICDDIDVCSGDDSSGDVDSDGICDDTDDCTAREFNGTSDYISVPTDPALDVGNNSTASWTVEGWFRSDTAAGVQFILGKGSGLGSADYDYMVVLHGNDEVIVWSTGSSVDTCAHYVAPLPAAGGWHHFAGTLAAAGSNTGTKELFVDGVSQGTCNYTVKAAAASGQDLLLGAQANPSATTLHFVGLLDEIRISSIVRYHDDFTPEIRLADDTYTVALWNFDGAGAGIDATLGGHNGVVAGTTPAPLCPDLDQDGDGIIAWLDCDDSNSALRHYDGSSEDCPAVSCLDILYEGYATVSGSYWIDPAGSGAFQAWCDMTEDNGGWTLIAMIHFADENNIYEPQDWLQVGNNPQPALSTNQFLTNVQPSAFGASKFTPLLGPTSIARFEAHQNGGAGAVETVYRQILSPQSFSNWWLPASEASLVCEDLLMTTGCLSRTLVGGIGSLTYVGLCSGGSVCWYARFSDDSQTDASSLNRPDWPSYFNSWGHGLKIWLRESSLP